MWIGIGNSQEIIEEVVEEGTVRVLDSGIAVAIGHNYLATEHGFCGKPCNTICQVIIPKEVFIEAYNKFIKPEVTNEE